jgi:hypothetical protein
MSNWGKVRKIVATAVDEDGGRVSADAIAHGPAAAITRLIELADKKYPYRDSQQLAKILQALAPALVSELADKSVKKLAQAVRCERMQHGDIICKENEAPHTYYFVVQGSIHVHANLPPDATSSNRSWVGDAKTCAAYGPCVAVVAKQTGFGELSILRDTTRTATGVVDGDEGACLLFVPRDVYISELSIRDMRKLHINQTLRFLQKIPVFKGWGEKEVIRVAYCLSLQKTLGVKDYICRVGDAASHVHFIKVGCCFTCE